MNQLQTKLTLETIARKTDFLKAADAFALKSQQSATHSESAPEQTYWKLFKVELLSLL